MRAEGARAHVTPPDDCSLIQAVLCPLVPR